jgi:flagellar biosynthesis protein FlhF
MPEAMLQIRNDLGSDAVILSTKETKIGGFLRMFRQKKIEVVAAVEDQEKAKPDKAFVSQARPSLTVPPKAVPQAYKKTIEMTTTASNPVTAAASMQVAVAERIEPALEAERTSEEITPAGSPNPDAFNELLGARVADEARSVGDEAKSRSLAEDKLLEELREMKGWMAKISRQSAMQRSLPDALQSLQDHLLQQELESDIIQDWISAAYEHFGGNDQELDEAELAVFIRNHITSFLSDRFGEGIAADTKVVYIAGPTGVGKTTTIAKLAADQLFRYHRKVGFITSDTYRISAVEQLRTYASILNVPLEVVQSPGDMQRAMQRLNYCDLILMDTAGRNYRNELLVSELQSLFSPEEKSETYLVLSLTSKVQDMKKIAEHFSRYGLDKVIFTKLDETGSYGSIINLIHEYPLKLSYMTNGQNVPDDLLLPEEQTICSLLLGEKGV